MANPKTHDNGKLSEVYESLDEIKIIDIFEKIIHIIYSEQKTDTFRGGLWPSNITILSNGEVEIGSGGPIEHNTWSAEQLEFLAPETFWSGENTPMSDVYAIGMLLYFCFSKGNLPFQQKSRDQLTTKERAGLLCRRMNGECIPIPEKLPVGMGKIIGKALSFSPSERYKNVLQMLPDIIACRLNLNKQDTKTGSIIFSKSDEKLTDIEKMMLGIINSKDKDNSEFPATKARKKNALYSAPINESQVERNKPTELKINNINNDSNLADSEKEIIENNQQAEKVSNRDIDAANGNGNGIINPDTPEQTIPSSESRAVNNVKISSESHTKATHFSARTKEKSSANKGHPQKNVNDSKKHNNSVIAVIVICAGLIILALIVSAITKHNETRSSLAPMNALNTEQVTATPKESGIVSATATPNDTSESVAPDNATGTSTKYQVITSDISWTDAKKECESNGGYLAVVNDEEEYQKIINMIATSGCRFAWIGCYKDSSGQFVWLNSNSDKLYYNWGEGEPSSYNTDGSVENYVMIYNTNSDLSGEWVYNDVQNDPVSEYPSIYSGNICYICEFDS